MYYLNSLDNVEIVDVPEIVALRKAKLFLGGGIDFYHKDEEIYKKWLQFYNNTDFFNFIFDRVRHISKFGGCIIGVEPTESGIPVFTISEPWTINSIASSYGTIDLVVFHNKIKIDNIFYLLKTSYDKEFIRRELYQYDAQDRKINMWDVISKLPKEKQVLWGEYDKIKGVYIYRHGLGMVPFVVLTNLPYLQHWTTLMGESYTKSKIGFASKADTANCRKLCDELQEVYRQMFKTAIIDKPRIVISNASQYAQNELRKNKNSRELGLQDIIYTANAPQSAQVRIATLNMTNSLEKYVDLEQAIWSQIFENAGLDYLIKSGTNKTTVESFLSLQRTSETINLLRNYLTPKIKQLVKIAFKLMGIDLEKDNSNWKFDIRSNIPVDMGTLRQNLSIDLQNGIIDQADYYINVYGGSRIEAENKIKWVKDFNKLVGYEPNENKPAGVSFPKSGQSQQNSKEGRKSDLEKGVKK